MSINISNINTITPGANNNVSTQKPIYPEASTNVVINNQNTQPVVKEAASSQQSYNQQELQDSIKVINQFLSTSNNNQIQFSLDQTSQQLIVRIVDRENQTVLRQIPAQTALDIAQQLQKLQGLIIQEQA